jgi:hypothetical protein
MRSKIGASITLIALILVTIFPVACANGNQADSQINSPVVTTETTIANSSTATPSAQVAVKTTEPEVPKTPDVTTSPGPTTASPATDTDKSEKTQAPATVPPVTETTRPAVTQSTNNVTITPTPGVVMIPVDPWFQKTVDALLAMQPDDFPGHLMSENATKLDSDFDVNKYFTVFKHISIEPGYTLDYVYASLWMFGGRPILYARRTSAQPYKNFEELCQAKGINDNNRIGLIMSGDGNDMVTHIKTDGTKEGYFEYLVLKTLGAQFYLSWHANYDDIQIVCDPAVVDRIVNEIKESDYMELPADDERRARELDYNTIIKNKGMDISISLVLFSKWGGFARISVTIGREYPYKITYDEGKVLIKYDCGVKF